jgi:hypothetical protein
MALHCATSANRSASDSGSMRTALSRSASASSSAPAALVMTWVMPSRFF